MRDRISVNHWAAKLGKDLSHGAFSAADAARQTDPHHD